MKFGMHLVLLIALMAMMMSTVLGQSSCTNVIISMAPCLAYITQNTSSPSQLCCDRLATVVRSSSECLCQVLEGGDSELTISVNQTQALALPKACHIQTPPVSRCNGGSSVNSHAGSSNTSEHGTNVTKTVPGEKSSSAGSYIKFSFALLVIIFTASYITILAKF